MKYLYLLIFCLAFFQNVFGQDTRKPLVEDDKRLIESLKTDVEFQEIRCWREETENNPEVTIRRTALEAFRLADREAKLKRTCHTIEGDPIFSYLIIKDGKASVVVDTTEDKFGSKQFFRYQCGRLAIGKYFYDENARKRIFEEIKDGDKKDRIIVLQCVAEEKEIIF